jgi:hypothetical protein
MNFDHEDIFYSFVLNFVKIWIICSTKDWIRQSTIVEFEFWGQIRTNIRISNPTFSVEFRLLSSLIRNSSELIWDPCSKGSKFVSHYNYSYGLLQFTLRISTKLPLITPKVVVRFENSQ